MLSGLDAGMFTQKCAEICVDLEFVRVRVQRPTCLELSNLAASNLKILLEGSDQIVNGGFVELHLASIRPHPLLQTFSS